MTSVKPASNNYISNIFAGITLSIVSLSLGAAFGIMSGRGALLGMLSAAVISFITSLLGGTRLQCSGPTAPVTVLVSGIIISSQSYIFPGLSIDQFINFVFLLAAGCLALFGVFRLGRFVSLIPNVVISGFMSGIGLVIFTDQIKKILEYQSISTTSDFLLFTGVTIFTLFLCIATPKITQKYIPKWSSILSGTLIAIFCMTFFVEVSGLEMPKIDLGNSDLGSLNTLFENQLPNLSALSISVFVAAFPMAIQLCLAMYLDTLLTSVILDRMTNTKSERNRELVTQSFGTVLVTLFGGVPGAQATVRSVLLIKEGATMRLAGVLVGIFSFIGIFVFSDYIGLIPQAVFIGILIKVAFDIFDLKPIRLYAKELFSQHVLSDFFSRHDDERIFVTNREIIFIIGTTLVTLFSNLIISVLLFTGLYHLCNQFVWKHNPIRDLMPIVETDTIVGED